MAGKNPLPLRGGCFGFLLLVSAFSAPFVFFPLPADGQQKVHSDRSAVVTSQGMQGTVSGGSSRNPLINDLITVQDLAEMQEDLKQLNRLLKELGMTFYLEQSRDMTMFMPVDAAFEQLPFNIHELSWQAKWRIVQYHIIPSNVVDLHSELQDATEKEFETWEGSALKVKKVTPNNLENGVASVEFLVNGDAKIISKPPKIETFNGASYKISKVLLPPTMTEEDLKPAKLEQRINPEVSQRLRRRPASEGTPSVEQEQQLASVQGTVQMPRSARDPRLPGSFRPDPLVQRSQATPDFVRGINSHHAKWDDAVFHRTPGTRARDERKPQDEIMGFQPEGDGADSTHARIKVLGLKEGAVLPTSGDQPAMTRIRSSGSPRPSSIGMAFESSERPESAPRDPVSEFMDVLLGGREAQRQQPAVESPKPQADGGNRQQPRQPQKEEVSLFSLDMTPTQPPRVQALGLTEGLLPSEELITHHWSVSSKAATTPRRSGERQQGPHAPLASLWQQINSMR